MHYTHVRYSIHCASPEAREQVVAEGVAAGATVGEKVEWTDKTGQNWWGVTFNPEKPLGWELNP